MTMNEFNIGEVVTFKAHPMFKSSRIKGDSRYVPPIMVIKEVFFENKEKKIADEVSGQTIADYIKYTCLYFDDNKGEFVENTIYQSMLRTFKDLNYERINNNGSRIEDYQSLITEIEQYKIPKYEYGKVVYFKTLKLEIYKKRSSKKIKVEKEGSLDVAETLQYVVNYASPQLVICGYKKEQALDQFYPTGKRKRIITSEYFKVKWFNPFQQKFCEQFMPSNFFTDENIFTDYEESNSSKNLPANPLPENYDFDSGKNR